MIIEITPLDTLFFRDGKPFSVEEDNWADGIFPPPPSVIYGALRSLYFANHMDEFEKFRNSKDEKDDPTKNLEISGIYLKDTYLNSLLFPVPLDTVVIKNGEDEDKKLSLLVINDNDKGGNCYFCLDNYSLLKSEEENEIEAAEKGFVKHNYLNKYLQSLKNDSINFFPLEYYIQIEPKVGIRRDDVTHASDEGAFYRVEMHRFKTLSIIVDFKNLEGIPDKGFMKLGGEDKAASYKKVDNFSLLPNYRPEIKNGKFKLYLATPAIFKNGWRPGWLDSGLNRIKPKLLAAAVGRYITIGGFDMKERKPKKMYRAVPAGSVYYFEALDGVDEQKLIETFHNKTISDVGSNEGLGLTFMGVV